MIEVGIATYAYRKQPFMVVVSGSVPDGYSCINCKVKAKDGMIRHTRTCPEYKPPRK